MPVIDLDAPIFVVPCSELGNGYRISGRAHICDDRLRIAVTECFGYCEECLEDTTPRVIDCLFSGVELCPDVTWLWGGLNEQPFRLRQAAPGGSPQACDYYTPDPVGVVVHNGEEYPIRAYLSFHANSVEFSAGWEWHAMKIFYWFTYVSRPYDCSLEYVDVANRNRLVNCGWPILGYGGIATVTPVL